MDTLHFLAFCLCIGYIFAEDATATCLKWMQSDTERGAIFPRHTNITKLSANKKVMSIAWCLDTYNKEIYASSFISSQEITNFD